MMIPLLLLFSCAPEKTSDDTAPPVVDLDGDGFVRGDDCDDEDPAVGGPPTWYRDLDQDGYGDPEESRAVCEAPSGYVDNGLDCADSDPESLGVFFYTDADGDGFGDPATRGTACEVPDEKTLDASDCDDTDPQVNPRGDEGPGDEVDEDCDGRLDCYADLDRDGAGFSLLAESDDLDCTDPYEALLADDCDDADATSYPGADERCDDADNDCDGEIDEDAIDERVFYLDADGDGYGDPDEATPSCDRPADHVLDATDCDDTRAEVSPGASERCDDLDNDCDGETDEIWTYPDADGDGYGDPEGGILGCPVASGRVLDDQDCDDTQGAVHPGAAEICGDGLDNSCDGSSDGCGIWGDERLEEADAIFEGESAGEGAGGALHAVDGDHDGALEVLVGAPDHDGGAGDQGVVYGLDLALDVELRLLGEGRLDGAGAAISSGDFDGDGEIDLILGVPGLDDAGENAGAAYLVWGPVTASATLSSPLTYGARDGDELGASLAGLGDLDGDGVDDYIVGSPNADGAGSASGAATLVMGGSSRILTGEAEGDSAGHTVARAGDLDGDGWSDALVGAWASDAGGESSGAVYVVNAGISDLADAPRLVGEPGDLAGCAIAGDADSDGDGYVDLLVGALGADDGGAAYLLLGPILGDGALADGAATLLAEAAGDGAGTDVAMGSDLDGDGLADLLVGAWGSDVRADNAGAAYPVLSPVEGRVVLGGDRLLGLSASDYAGSGLLAPGDLDGDGLGDLLVSATGAGDGTVYLWRGGAL